MNNVIKGVGLFLLGAGAGSAATYFYMKKNNKIEYEIIKSPIKIEDNVEEEASDEEPETEEEEVVEEKGWSVVNMADEIEPRFTDYSAMSRYDEPTKMMEHIVPQPTDEEMEMIHEITEQEFVDGHLEARTFSIWMLDEQLYDEDNDTIDVDVKNTIGEWLLDKFMNDDEKETIYIRNENTGTDYEVFKREQSYGEYTMNRE